MSYRFPPGLEILEGRALPAAAFQSLPILPTADPAVLDNARAIALLGQELGRRTDVFMKIGDSNTSTGGLAAQNYLNPLGAANYNPVASGLADYGSSIVQTLDAFDATVDAAGENSFTRSSISAYPGYTVPIVTPLVPGELAATDAGIAFIMIGTNDVGDFTPASDYQTRLENIVRTLTAAGVIPVLSTLPDQTLSAANEAGVLAYNQVIANVGAEFDVPVWNFWAALQALPSRGLNSTGVHLTVSPYGGGAFDPASLEYGQNVRNLEALQILDWYRTDVVDAPVSVPQLQPWVPLTAGESVYAVGPGAGQPPVVDVYATATGQLVDQLLTYEPSFTGGVNVAVGDVNGDGIPDIITGPGTGGSPLVKVFSGKDASLIGAFFAFESTFRTGVTVAAADLDGDGKAEVVVGAGDGGAPVVAVYHGGDLAPVERFFAFDPNFRGGVSVAAADLAGYGPAIVVGAGVGGGPVVQVYRYDDLTPVASYLAYGSSARFGVNVAAGDLTGSGAGQIVTAPMANSTEVRVIDPATGAGLENFFAADPAAPGGARVAVAGGDLLVANGPGSSVSVAVYSGLSTTPAYTSPDDPTRGYGLYVG